MSKAIINFKVDVEVKEQAQRLAQRLGVPLSTVINAQLKQFLRTRSFTVNDTVEMSPELESILGEIENDRRQGRNFSPTFDSVEDMFAHLNKKHA